MSRSQDEKNVSLLAMDGRFEVLYALVMVSEVNMIKRRV